MVTQTPKSDANAIFDDALLKLRQERAEKRVLRRGPGFLLERCVEDLKDRLHIFNRQFDHGLCIAPGYAESGLRVLNIHPKIKQITVLPSVESLPDQRYDLAISILELHHINDVKSYVQNIRNVLTPDSPFLACCFGPDTLSDIRQTLYDCDTEFLGGATPRVFPFMTHEQAGGLLGACGLTMPVVDRDRVRVNYRKFSTLVGDIRDIGDGNCLSARNARNLSKLYFSDLERRLTEQSESGHIETVFDIFWLTGWSPHSSQPKPLKPGSGKISLAEAIKPQNT